MVDVSRERAEGLDAADPLAHYAKAFVQPDEDLIYLDGNSLGMLPLSARDRLHEFVDHEWGQKLVRGWDEWISMPLEVGDRLGGLIGAAAGQVVVCDSISVNIYKLAVAALEAQPGRKVLVTDAANFPSDRYVLAGAAERRRGQLRLVPTTPLAGLDIDKVQTYLADDVAMVAFSYVDFRSAAIADVQALTDLAHRAGALVLWDLAHSVGSVPIDLDGVGADFAVGCTYKYLNAGPGSPGFLYVRKGLQDKLRNPIQGWWSTSDQFDMDAPYQPASGIATWQTGTPSIPGVIAVDEGVKQIAEAGLDRVRAKSVALTSYLIELSDAWLTPLGFSVASSREDARRGGHVVLAHDDATQINQALAKAGVIGDVRPPNLLRLAPVALTTSFVEVWEGMTRIRDVAASGT